MWFLTKMDLRNAETFFALCVLEIFESMHVQRDSRFVNLGSENIGRSIRRLCTCLIHARRNNVAGAVGKWLVVPCGDILRQCAANPLSLSADTVRAVFQLQD